MGRMKERFFANLEVKFDSLRSWANQLGLGTMVELLDENAHENHKGNKYQYMLIISDLEVGNTALFGALDITAEASGFQQGINGWFYFREDREDGLAKERERLFA